MRTSSKIYLGITGILLVALGVVCIAVPQVTVASIAWLLGLFILVSGIATLLAWIDLRHYIPFSGSVMVTSILEIIIGLLFLFNNFTVSNAFPYIFAIFALGLGLSLAIHSFDFKHVRFKYWWVMFILGVIACALGIITFMRPLTGTYAISILLGIAIILNGLVYIVALCGISKFERKVSNAIDEINTIRIN